MALFWSPRIDTKRLCELCRRVGMGLVTGVDIRKVMSREAERSRGHLHTALSTISDQINRGASFSDALDATEDYFPELFREMVRVGEQTGNLGEMLRQLADDYEFQVAAQKTMLTSLIWPAIQVVVGVCSISVLIWVSGYISTVMHADVDFLGLGLKGKSGVIIFVSIVGSIVAAIVLLVRLVMRGGSWTRSLHRTLLSTPKFGTALKTLALERLTWTLYMTTEAGMEMKRSIELSLRSTHSTYYTEQANGIWASIRRGATMHEAFDSTGVFPPEFTSAVEVAEHSGKLPEMLKKLSEQYREEARRAISFILSVFRFVVGVVLAVVILTFVFRFYSQYIQNIQNIVNGH